MNTQTQERIKEIEERLAKATPGPWKSIGLSISGPKHPRSRYPDGTIHIASVSSGMNRIDGSYAYDGTEIDMAGDGFSDANFISNAPDDMRFLLEKLKESGKRYDELNDFEKLQCSKLLIKIRDMEEENERSIFRRAGR